VLVVVVESASAAAPHELTFGPAELVSIGRDPSSRVQLPDASVSLRHALLRPSNDGYVVVDEGSTNGTFLNAVRVSQGSVKPLADGDLIAVGRARLRVRFTSPSTAPKEAFSTQDLALAMVQGALLQAGAAVIPRVTVVAGPDRGLELVLREERSYVLGRDVDVDLRLTDEDASRRHTRLVRRGSRLWVIDLGSKNGTSLDGRPLRPNVAEAWSDVAVLQLGQNQLTIDDPVSSALRNLERVPDEKLSPDYSLREPGSGAITARIRTSSDARSRPGAPSDRARTGFGSVNEPKGVLSLSTSSSSSAPSAPIEVLQLQAESDAPRGQQKKRTPWSALDAFVVGVAVVTIALSALALAWFLAS
jgi:pSer/pThr/pTyr-binding forkhead associated (FHA) protein